MTNECLAGRGDVIACPNKPCYALKGTCGGVYGIYRKKAGGGYEKPELIVCST